LQMHILKREAFPYTFCEQVFITSFWLHAVYNFHHVPLYLIKFIWLKTNCLSLLGIHKYADEFCLVGGVNAPKKVRCVGTDGIVRTQLVKV
jgi:hypothetical protein